MEARPFSLMFLYDCELAFSEKNTVVPSVA